MAIVRPTVGGSFTADPRQAQWDKKWEGIHANTMNLANMAIQAKLRQDSIDQALQSIRDEAEIAKDTKRLEELGGLAAVEEGREFMGGQFGQAMQPEPSNVSTVQNPEQLSAMIAQGVQGTPMVTIPGVEPRMPGLYGKHKHPYPSQGRSVTMPAEERLAKMLRYRDVMEAEGERIEREQMRERMVEAEGDDWRLAAQDEFAGATAEEAKRIANANAIRDLVNQMGGPAGGMRWATQGDTTPTDLYAQRQAARAAMDLSPQMAATGTYGAEMGEAGRSRRIEEVLRLLRNAEMNRLGWGNIGGGSGMPQTWGPGLSPRD